MTTTSWRVLLLISLTAAAPGRAQLVPDWRSVRSTHFEFVSRYDPAKTRPLVLDLEWARSVFEMNFGVKSRLDRQVLVLLQDSPSDYNHIGPSELSGGYYLGAPWRDIIVLKELLNARQGLLHEYTHLVLHHEGGRWPGWFNEGTAVFYETMRGTKEGIEAGAPEPGRLAILRKGAWAPISYILSVDSAAKLPSLEATQRFYAQSWVYVHMLHLAPAYRDHFPEFRALTAEGASLEDLVRRIYSKSLIQFDDDARAWSRQERFPTERLQAPPEAAATVETRVIERLDVEIARGIAAGYGSSKSPDGGDYPRLAQLVGSQCDRQPALGDLAFAERRFLEASRHYQEALRCGVSSNALLQGLESALSFRSYVSEEELKSLGALIGSGRTYYLLGMARFSHQDYEGALAAFGKASGVSQPELFGMTRATALSLAELERSSEAAEAAKRLTGLASNVFERESAQVTSDYVTRVRPSVEKPPDPPRKLLPRGITRIEGEIIRIECMDERARVWLRSGSETKKLLIADLGGVFTEPDGGSQFEFKCGTQKRGAIIGYLEQPDPATDTIGRVRYVELR